MRREERAGIIFLLLTLLWGTPVAEPFRIFAGYFVRVLRNAAEAVSISGIIFEILRMFFATACTVILLRITTGKAALILPLIILVLSGIGYTITTLVTGNVDGSEFLSLAILTAVMLVLYLLKLELPIKWLCDAYIYSLPEMLLVGLVMVPVSKLGDVMGKMVLSAKYDETGFTDVFAGKLGMPALVWGIFFAVLCALPIIFRASVGDVKKEKDEWIR